MKKMYLRTDVPRKPEFDPQLFVEAEMRRTVPAHRFVGKTKAEWKRWRGPARAALAKSLGLMPKGGAAPRLKLLDSEERDGYTLHYGEVTLSPELATAVFLLIPDGLKPGEQRPGVLCVNGHGDGVNPLVGFDAAGKPLAEEEYQHCFAEAAVRQGFVVMAYELLSFGRRRMHGFGGEYPGARGCHHTTMTLQQLGYTITGLRVWEARQLATLLGGLPEVKASRLGIAGISGGGLVTLYTAALESKLKAACVSGYTNRFDDCIMRIHHCECNYVPGLYRQLDIPDIGALIAPRSLLVQSGLQDTIFPIKATRAAVAHTRKAFRAAGAPKKIDTDYFDAAHEFRNEKVWPWMWGELV